MDERTRDGECFPEGLDALELVGRSDVAGEEVDAEAAIGFQEMSEGPGTGVGLV